MITLDALLQALAQQQGQTQQQGPAPARYSPWAGRTRGTELPASPPVAPPPSDEERMNRFLDQFQTGGGIGFQGAKPAPAQQPAAPIQSTPGSGRSSVQFQMPTFQMPTFQALPPVEIPNVGTMPGRMDDLLAAGQNLAADARWRANPLGAVGNPEDRARAEAIAAQVANAYVGAAASAEGDASRLNQARLQAGVQGAVQQSQQNIAQMLNQREAGQGAMNAQAQIEAARLAAQSHIQGAQIQAEAQHDPRVTMNQGVGALITGMATGQIQPEAFRAGIEMMRGHFGQPMPGATPAAPGTTRTPEQVIGNIASGNQALSLIAPILGTGTIGKDYKLNPELGEGQANQLAQHLAGAKLSPDQMNQLIEKLRGGSLGDPQAIRNAVARAAATNYLITAGAPRDSGGNYAGMVSPQYGGSSLMNITETQPNAYTPGALAARMSRATRAGNLPYNTIDLLDGMGSIGYTPPSALAGGWGGTFTPQRRQQATELLPYQAELLRQLTKGRGK